MADHSRSALLALVLVVVCVVGGQLFKESLASSRQGTFIAGVLGSFVFMFTLTAISNLKMSSAGQQNTSGLSEVALSLALGVLSSALIHRIAITICVLFSIGLTAFLNGIAQTRYAPGGVQSVGAGGGKKRK